MKLAIFIVFSIGIFLIVYGIYEEKLRIERERVKVEYRFVPRSFYEEQLFDNQVKNKMGKMFGSDDAWYDRNIGRDIGFDRRKIRNEEIGSDESNDYVV
jgi:hypothetical protein